MLATVLTPQLLAHQVGEHVKCDSSSKVAGATRRIAKASGATPDDGVCFPGEFIIASAFALGQVDCYGELHPLQEVAPASNEPLVPSPLLGLLGADLEVLTQLIYHGLGLNQTIRTVAK
jgi:hypothetical protein